MRKDKVILTVLKKKCKDITDSKQTRWSRSLNETAITTRYLSEQKHLNQTFLKGRSLKQMSFWVF